MRFYGLTVIFHNLSIIPCGDAKFWVHPQFGWMGTKRNPSPKGVNDA